LVGRSLIRSSSILSRLLIVGILRLVLVHAIGSVLLCLLICGSLVCCSHRLGRVLRLVLVYQFSGGSILLCLSIGGGLLLLSCR
jgi:hypothetical protein